MRRSLKDMMPFVNSLLDLPLQAHRSRRWASLDPRDIWGRFVDIACNRLVIRVRPAWPR
ncbi:unnamed protein product [Ectocarpus sp. CCAP 1310/34]|nr:unnamed protein product [Ectocarpus sp. CCAP 1310/34]